MSTALAYAVLLPTLLVAHNVADYWVQTDSQAATKGQPGWPGRRACAAHVATYTVTLFVVIVLVELVIGLRLSNLGIALGLAVSAVTHYWADRRTTLAWLADRLRWLGKDEFYRFGAPREGRDDNPTLGTGAYILDQSFHWLWLLVAALVMVAT